ncbi:MAG: hypothetical protein SGARI_005259 [Bacillariaceae sp.]
MLTGFSYILAISAMAILAPVNVSAGAVPLETRGMLKVFLEASTRGMGISTFAFYEDDQLLVGKDGELTPLAKSLLQNVEDMPRLVEYKRIILEHAPELYDDIKTPPINDPPPVAEIQVDYDCEDSAEDTFDYLMCTFDLIDICNSSSNCELLLLSKVRIGSIDRISHLL